MSFLVELRLVKHLALCIWGMVVGTWSLLWVLRPISWRLEYEWCEHDATRVIISKNCMGIVFHQGIGPYVARLFGFIFYMHKPVRYINFHAPSCLFLVEIFNRYRYFYDLSLSNKDTLTYFKMFSLCWKNETTYLNV